MADVTMKPQANTMITDLRFQLPLMEERRSEPDAPGCGRIGYEAFKTIAEQHHFPPDFPPIEIAIGLYAMILGRSDIFSVVRECDGQIVCSNFLWEGDAIAGVGPITALPAVQNASRGRRLMRSVLDRLSSAPDEVG